LRKRRTRSHVLAELSANHVERYALLCGYSVERVAHDYGIDLVLTTYDANGEIENGPIFLQLKATDAPRRLRGGQAIAVSLRRSDLEHWLQEIMPVILVLYDGPAQTAYWLYVQAHFEAQPGFDLSATGNTVTVHVNRSQMVDETAMRRFARFRDTVLAQVGRVIRHHA
jgi:hypothetical protein